jgi:predicted transcriptional regulator YdeE
MSAAGKQPDALIETWTAIWSSDLGRTYATDFEVYGPRFFEDGVNEVLIHVGVE